MDVLRIPDENSQEPLKKIVKTVDLTFFA